MKSKNVTIEKMWAFNNERQKVTIELKIAHSRDDEMREETTFVSAKSMLILRKKRCTAASCGRA